MPTSQYRFFSTYSLWLPLLLIACMLVPRLAIGAEAQKQTTPSSANNQWAILKQSLEKSIAREQGDIARIKSRLAQAQNLKKKVDADLEACKAQSTASGNMLLLGDSKTRELEQSQAQCESGLNLIAAHLKNLTSLSVETDQELQQTQRDYDLAQKQLEDIRNQETKDPETRFVLQDFAAFLDVLSEKRTLLKELAGLYQTQVRNLKDNMDALAHLSNQFRQQILQRKKEELFKRNLYPLILPSWEALQHELARLVDRAARMTDPAFWKDQFKALLQTGTHFIVTGFIFLLVVFVLLRRLHQFCIRLLQTSYYQQYPWRCLTMRLFQRSLPLLATTLFIYVYAHVQNLYSILPVVRLLVWLFAIALCTRWVMDLVKFWPETKQPAIPTGVANRLRRLAKLIRFFAAVYVILAWMLDNSGFLLPAARLIIEMGLLWWAVCFRKVAKTQVQPDDVQRWFPFYEPGLLVLALVYVAVGGALVLELAGFGSLALYWLMSWGRSAMVVLWFVLLLLVINEWYRHPEPVSDDTQAALADASRPYRWLVSRFLWFAWLALLAISLLLAWGAKQTVLVGVGHTLTYPFVVGQMRFSLMGVVLAAVVLFLTRLSTRLWRHILQEKILADSGMETGVQNSITSITVYALWVLGILIGLHAFGLNTTTLAVGFGALGIGLGFGLQNIFNNFISGIILLFERPIQVGDAVEINGVWAEVKKINVRSTVVQTYDNASLIIPNSEFISNSVTNWSFKDLSLRRNISVGVAYGSDIELTRQTLLEIAAKTEKVFRYPKPDVLFTDFGDSALIFKLRIWTDVDSMLKVETAIRFEIDRLFREQNIEIAFPQRDIHIRSVVANTAFTNTADNEAPKE